ncbi:MAG: hypothetical protein JO147_02205 [Actinobacteria bacterium]|nr:hypothetical protein [Actinomycetota bacterium]
MRSPHRRPLIGLFTLLILGTLLGALFSSAWADTGAHAPASEHRPLTTTVVTDLKPAQVILSATELSSRPIARRADGACFAASAVAAGAYRCTEGLTILDPCFVVAWDTSLHCVIAPWSAAVALRTNPALDGAATTPPSGAGAPWGVRLVSGAQCVLAIAAVPAVGDEGFPYACDDGGFMALTDEGRADYLGPHSAGSRPVGIDIVWTLLA